MEIFLFCSVKEKKNKGKNQPFPYLPHPPFHMHFSPMFVIIQTIYDSENVRIKLTFNVSFQGSFAYFFHCYLQDFIIYCSKHIQSAVMKNFTISGPIFWLFFRRFLYLYFCGFSDRTLSDIFKPSYIWKFNI